jgi:hypothetical protein
LRALQKAVSLLFKLDLEPRRVEDDDQYVYYEQAVLQIWRQNLFHDSRLPQFSQEAWLVDSEPKLLQATKGYPWKAGFWAAKTGPHPRHLPITVTLNINKYR